MSTCFPPKVSTASDVAFAISMIRHFWQSWNFGNRQFNTGQAGAAIQVISPALADVGDALADVGAEVRS